MISKVEFDKIAQMPEDTEGVVSVRGDAKTTLTLSPTNDRFQQISQERQENNIYVRSQLLTAIRSALADRLDDQTDNIAQDFFKEAERKLFGKLDKDGRYGVKFATSDLKARVVRQLIDGLNKIKDASDSLIPKGPDDLLAEPDGPVSNDTQHPAPTSLIGRFRRVFEQLPEALENKFPEYGELDEKVRNGFREELRELEIDLENKRLARSGEARKIFLVPYDRRTLNENEELQREAWGLTLSATALVSRLVSYLADAFAAVKNEDRDNWIKPAENIRDFIADKVQVALDAQAPAKRPKKDLREKVDKKMTRLEGEVSRFKDELEAVKSGLKAKENVEVSRRRELYDRYCDLKRELKKLEKFGDADLNSLFAAFKKARLEDLPSEKKVLAALKLSAKDVSIAEVVQVKSYKKELGKEHLYMRPVRSDQPLDMVLGGEKKMEVKKFSSVWQNHYLTKDKISGKKK